MYFTINKLKITGQENIQFSSNRKGEVTLELYKQPKIEI